MTLQKINIGAVPNDGTGDNNRAAWQKVNAAFTEIDSLGTGKLDANDPSVTNAREWTASVVSQTEAEAGTATTARKWTAQRVWQAVVAATQGALNLKANLASPALTGTPTAPTAVTTTNTTQIATTAFVQAVNSADTGSAATAVKLKTARTINGTSFDGSTNITTANWGTARNITIGGTAKSVNGSANVSWSLAEIGAAASNHTHDYLPLSGGTLTGRLDLPSMSIGRPANAWTNVYYAIDNFGSLYTEGSYFVTLSSNGYRNGDNNWTSLNVNGLTGASVISLDPAGKIYFKADSNKATGTSSFPTTRMTLHSDGNLDITGLIRADGSYSATVAASANVNIDSSGYFRRSTSSLRYKDCVEDVEDELMQAVIDNARPIWYRSLCEVDDRDMSWWGLGAEELGAIDPRFVHWAHPIAPTEIVEQTEFYEPTVETDEDGNPITKTVTREERRIENRPDTSQPKQAEGVMYDRLVVPLLWHAKKMQARIEALESRLAVMEDK